MSSNQMKQTVVNYPTVLMGIVLITLCLSFLFYTKDNSSIFFIGLFTDKVL